MIALRLVKRRGCVAAEDRTNSPSVVMTKSRFLKRTRVPRTQLTLRLAIQGRVLMSRCAKDPYQVRQLSVFRESTG